MIALEVLYLVIQMKLETIKKLNALNLDFYQKVAQHFSDTRDQAWPGWQQLLPLIHIPEDQPLRVLDVGCGNGRFAIFLAESLPETQIVYTGIDFSEELLRIARQNLKAKNLTVKLIRSDIVTEQSEAARIGYLDVEFDLVVSFGVLHHIPSQKLRSIFVKTFLTLLSPGGSMVVTAWQFMKSDRQRQKVVDPTLAGISETLEPNDYIMSWDGQTSAYRYAHHFDAAEINALLPQKNYTVHQYQADGKEGNLNQYLVLTKN